MQVDQRQRLHQLRVLQGLQRRKAVQRRGKAGHPGQHAVGDRGLVVGVDPGVEPVARVDGALQFGVATAHQCQQFGGIVSWWQRPALDVQHNRLPACWRHHLRLQDHAAQVAVERHHVHRLQRRRQCGQQVLQAVEVGIVQGGDGRVRRGAGRARGMGHARIVVLCRRPPTLQDGGRRSGP